MRLTYILSAILAVFSLSYSMSFFTSSQQGIGIRQYVTTARGAGMGGTGLAHPSLINLNTYNTASWRHIPNTRFGAMMRYDNNTIDLGFQEISTSTGNFQGLQLAVPIVRGSWAFGLSLTPYTLVDFSYKQNITRNSRTYEEDVFLKGSLSKLQVGLAHSLNKKFGIALNFNYYFGTITDRYRLIFDDPAFFNSNTEIEYRFRGPGAGLSFDAEPFDSLHFGGFFDIQPDLNFATITFSPISFQEKEVQTSATLPVNWGIGGSYHFAKYWTVESDFVFQHWSKGFNMDNFDTNQLEDWYHFGFGIEHGHSRGRSKVFINLFDLRAGFSMGNIGYKFNNESVQEYAGHLGLGIPFNNDRGRFDIAFKAGIRGDRGKTLAQEKFYRLIISISAGELWFQDLR